MCAAFVAALCLAASAAIAAPPPVEAFGNLPAISHVHLSPDGKHFAAVEPVDGRPVVMVYDVNAAPDSKPIGFDEPGGIPIDVYWANDDRLICLYYAVINQVSARHGAFMRVNARAISVSIGDKEPVILLRGVPAYGMNGSTVGVVGRDATGDHVYIVAYDADAHVSLYRADVEDQRGGEMAGGSSDTADWVAGLHGEPVARLDYTQETSGRKSPITEHLFLPGRDWTDSGTFETFTQGAIDVYGVTQDGSALVVGRYSGNTRGAQSFNFATRSFGPVLYSNPDYDIIGALHDDWTGAVTGVVYESDKIESYYFDPVLARIQQGLQTALPGESVEIVSYDEARDTLIVRSGDPQHPATYWLYDTTTKQLKVLAGAYPTLQPTDLGAMKPYPYKARDGLDIHAYLTLPPGKAAHNLPVVIFPHGGPEERDSADFEWWSQFMASRGYAVLQPNFRGSAGYGWKFQSAGFNQWRRAMQDDVTDGVKKLIADGIADPKRICIVGASYGGYAALAGATFTPDLYACAVSVAGVSNLIGLQNSVNGMAYWTTRIGDVDKDADALNAASPALHADQVRAPILLMHGEKDVTVPIDQSVQERDALKKAGKDVSFVPIDGDDHYLNLASTRIRVLTEIAAFLDAHIGH
jgi:dipeptidyl aminopeptidase/acylaminoacyl peptidase